MKYYLFLTLDYNDGTKSSKSIYEYDSLNEAIANFHKQLGGWMLKDNVSHILAMVLNSEGGVYGNLVETYHANTVAVQEASEE